MNKEMSRVQFLERFGSTLVNLKSLKWPMVEFSGATRDGTTVSIMLDLGKLNTAFPDGVIRANWAYRICVLKTAIAWADVDDTQVYVR